MRRCAALLFVVAFVFTGTAFGEGYDPPGLLLTWQRDPATTMTIDWHSLNEDARGNVLQYRAEGAEEWSSAEAAAHPFPYAERTVHRVELTGLSADTMHEFRCGEDGRVLKFRTMQAELKRPIRFAEGGDTRHKQEWMEKTNRAAMAYEPDFMVWGGDFAYEDGRPDKFGLVIEFFDAIKNTLITAEGRVVPVIGCIGNHEVFMGTFRAHLDFIGDNASRERVAPYFYALFAFPGHPGYNVLDFGDYLSFVALDTEHTAPVAGQVDWLEETLAKRSEVPHVFPVYHVPAFPSNRSYDGPVSASIREHWVPLFEKHGVGVAFEHHDHAYKRTRQIRGGAAVDDGGIVYFGDGAWGVSTRDVHLVDETWYLARAESKRHAIIVTLDGDKRSFITVDEDGTVIDTYPEAE